MYNNQSSLEILSKHSIGKTILFILESFWNLNYMHQLGMWLAPGLTVITAIIGKWVGKITLLIFIIMFIYIYVYAYNRLQPYSASLFMPFCLDTIIIKF